MTKLTITKRSEDYHVQIKGQPGYWECGKDPFSAIKNLIRTHEEMFEDGAKVPEMLGAEV